MFVNKYKDTMFDLPDADNNTFLLGKMKEHGSKEGMEVGPPLESVILKE